MHRAINLAFLLIILITGCKQAVKNVHLNKNKPDDFNVRIKVPDEWIEKLRRFDYSRNTKPIISEFEKIIKPDTIHKPHARHIDEDYGRMLNPIFADLDGEPGEELVCLLGWDYSFSDLCVFKRTDGNWYLIYMEPIDTFYSAPSLTIAGNFSKNKVFYFRYVNNHGSGVYEDRCSFYKLIDGNIYKCLDIVNKAHIVGWGLFVNQQVESSFEFLGDEKDLLNVNYNYNFFHTGDGAKDESGDVSLIKNEATVSYQWDVKSNTYKLGPGYAPLEVDDLNETQIKCFGAFGNDTLFVRAFKNQLNQVLKTGTPKQKQVLREYFGQLKKTVQH